MARWDPGSRGRLHEAALELYAERGFESTTVAEIAQRAGVTERTYFRHFGDKREVLFAAGEALQEALTSTVAALPATVTPLEAVVAGLEAVAAELPDRETACRRRVIIDSNSGLRERDLMKHAGWATALAESLRDRGVSAQAAAVVAEVGIAIFEVAHETWTDGTNDRSLTELINELVEELRSVVSE